MVNATVVLNNEIQRWNVLLGFYFLQHQNAYWGTIHHRKMRNRSTGNVFAEIIPLEIRDEKNEKWKVIFVQFLLYKILLIIQRIQVPVLMSMSTSGQHGMCWLRTLLCQQVHCAKTKNFVYEICFDITKLFEWACMYSYHTIHNR